MKSRALSTYRFDLLLLPILRVFPSFNMQKHRAYPNYFFEKKKVCKIRREAHQRGENTALTSDVGREEINLGCLFKAETCSFDGFVQVHGIKISFSYSSIQYAVSIRDENWAVVMFVAQEHQDPWVLKRMPACMTKDNKEA